jgi:hypothetical protein
MAEALEAIKKEEIRNKPKTNSFEKLLKPVLDFF